MILGIEKELAIFAQAILTGIQLCLIYKGIGYFRKLIPHKSFLSAVEDLFYWVYASACVFQRLQRNCNGNIRWYFVVGLLGGSVITHNFVQKIGRKYIAKSKKTE